MVAANVIVILVVVVGENTVVIYLCFKRYLLSSQVRPDVMALLVIIIFVKVAEREVVIVFLKVTMVGLVVRTYFLLMKITAKQMIIIMEI